MNYLKITDVELKNKKVLIRVDFNVPIVDGKITSTARIDSSLESIKYALQNDASVILMSHLGRPEEGVYDEKYSLKLVCEYLSHKLDKEVIFKQNWLENLGYVNSGDVILCENVRFNAGEKNNDEALSRKIASMCDVFVMEAFATAHRKQSSTYGVAKYAPVVCAGFLFDKEVESLTSALKSPEKPLCTIIGGAKVSSKLTVLHNLLDKTDILIVGGGIGITFLAAQGYNIGNSIVEKDLFDEARNIIELAKKNNISMPLPVDVRVSKTFDKYAGAVIKDIDKILDDDMILDIGPKTEKIFTDFLSKSKTILWNGPVGVFEFENFCNGTKALALKIASSNAFSVAGGGDTISAIEKFKIQDNISYISTAGGAFLEFLEGKKLPVLEILEAKQRENNL